MKKVTSCCESFLVPPDSGEETLSSFLQPFTGGPGQDVSWELNTCILA